jgi:hypothetical protein
MMLSLGWGLIGAKNRCVLKNIAARPWQINLAAIYKSYLRRPESTA